MYEKNLKISMLLDYYGEVLTDKQRDAVDLYYNEDLSLAEIAEHVQITRQGVRDAIKRGEETLFELEDKLHFAERFNNIRDSFEEIAEYVGIIKSSKTNLQFHRILDEYLNKIDDTIRKNI